MATKAFDRKDFESFLKLLPSSLDGVKLRHAVEPRHESFRTPDFIALARDYDVCIITAADSEFPLIADITTSFSYLRIMGTRENEPQGYAAHALDVWAKRLKSYALGDVPADIERTVPSQGAATPSKASHDVYAYVISGEKVRNPAAAMALIERVAT